MIRSILAIVLVFSWEVILCQNLEKEAKKQLKTLQKEGWETLDQDGELLNQLIRSLELRSGESSSKVLVSQGSAVTSNFEIAMKASKLDAQRNLAGLFASSVSSRVQTQKSGELEAFLSKSVVKIAASLKSTTVMRVYRQSGDDYEFRTIVSCSLRDFWNLLPSEDKSTLKNQFGLTDETFENSGG